MTSLARNLMASLRAVFERQPDAALEHATPIFEAFPDPEAVFYAARNLAYFGEPRALSELGRALDRGFVLYRVLLRDDPWLDPLRPTRAFQELLERSRALYRESLEAYAGAGGEQLLGLVPTPEALDRLGSLPAR